MAGAFINHLKNIKMNNVYGVIECGIHTDVSKTERGAKKYATQNGFKTVSIRYNGGYISRPIAEKRGNRWVDLA